MSVRPRILYQLPGQCTSVCIISALFPYNNKTQSDKERLDKEQKATLYEGVIKRPGRPENDYP